MKRRAYIRRSSKPIRRSRVRPMRQGSRANLARECARLWSEKVRAKNFGFCIFAGNHGIPCSGRIDPAHAFPKGACPAGKYDVDLGEPVCRYHHRLYGNGSAWREFLFRVWWGPSLYAERYAKAHVSGAKLDLKAVRAELSK